MVKSVALQRAEKLDNAVFGRDTIIFLDSGLSILLSASAPWINSK